MTEQTKPLPKTMEEAEDWIAAAYDVHEKAGGKDEDFTAIDELVAKLKEADCKGLAEAVAEQFDLND